MTRETTGDVTADIQEEISGIREALAFNRIEANIARFRERNRANRDANVAAVVVTAAFAPTIDVLSTLATAVVIGFGGYLLLTGQLSVGVVAAFLIYVQQFFRPIQLISQVYTPLQAALAGAERIYAILDEPEEAPDPARALVLDGVDGRVTFDGVSFGYDPTLPVLHDVSFDVAAGQTVALVGRTGAGKTTMVGDRPKRDGGAAAVGITTLILPPVPNYTSRGLDLVLQLVQCAVTASYSPCGPSLTRVVDKTAL